MQVASKMYTLEEQYHADQTVLILRPQPWLMTACIYKGTLAQGSTAVTIDWGDGEVQTLPAINNATHTYRDAKEYVVKISNDLKLFAFTRSMAAYRYMLTEVVRIGSKVTSIDAYGFNNCKNMRGSIILPNVTDIGGYAFGSTVGITSFNLPMLTHLSENAFYTHPSPTQIFVDNVMGIDSEFWVYYGDHLHDMYIRNKTCEHIKAMNGFPFAAGATVRFHGSNGIVYGDGTIIHNTNKKQKGK